MNIKWPWKKKEQKEKKEEPVDPSGNGFFDTSDTVTTVDAEGDFARKVSQLRFNRTPEDFVMKTEDSAAMDSLDETKSAFTFSGSGMPPDVMGYFLSQSFIGYQSCAILAQNWLIGKACSVSVEDAVRNGFEISRIDGGEMDPAEAAKIKTLNKKYRLKYNLENFEKFNRVFGIRIAMFKFKNKGENFYRKPFNIDGVAKGSYLGIAQIDPYWITPELTAVGANDPSNIDFYEPEFWRVNGMLVHKSHLIISRYKEVADVLKPTYYYGGIPLTQLIYNRVYGSERTADESPLLAMTKRLNVLGGIDFEAAAAQEQSFIERIQQWAQLRNNYGVQVVGGEERVEQHDTSLADVDDVIMTQYQLVAAVCNTPATKLLGTSPKGFNSTGEAEAKNYTQELVSIQENRFDPLVERHFEIVQRSDLNEDFDFEVSWNPTDTPTNKELAELNESKSRTAKSWFDMGAVDGYDGREALIKDEDSMFYGLEKWDEGDGPDSEEDDEKNQLLEDDESGEEASPADKEEG